MCLVTEQKKPIITKKDMIVWKVVVMRNGKANSPFNSCVWRKNVLRKVKFKITDEEMYTDGTARIEYESLYNENKTISIRRGFHFCFTKKRCSSMMRWGNKMEVKFLIPAGSEIYKDKTGLGVTNQIMML